MTLNGSSRHASWPVALRHGTLTLRPLTRRDRRAWEEQRRVNADWLTPWDATSPVPGTAPASFAQIVRWHGRQARAGTSYTWGIALDEDAPGRDRLIGLLSLGGVQYGSVRSGAVGYWIDRRHAGQGIAPTAVAMCVDWALHGLGLHRVEVNIRPENRASLRVVEKLGLREEGLRRAYLHVDGAWRDHRSFAVTAEEVPEGLLARWLASRPVG
ncbi:GNAT family protein [Micrococcus sp.]|uniref:GNAT family N-acetyltransferase n=1 Tax=Micrococcus sp. TaxID=1271 RepID=UPI002A909771|nr:GNAT family protein [Micrococcus sp.]MDY6055812.1 GNAT family protein [Micrococcus sp.]